TRILLRLTWCSRGERPRRVRSPERTAPGYAVTLCVLPQPLRVRLDEALPVLVLACGAVGEAVGMAEGDGQRVGGVEADGRVLVFEVENGADHVPDLLLRRVPVAG